MTKSDDTLSIGSSQILKEVLNAMQAADELGGPDTVADYQALMLAIAFEALQRSRMAADLAR